MRILTVLEFLQSRDAISGQELADHLEVSLRTVQRYIVRLQDLGVPVDSTRGPGGSYRLRTGYRMPPVMFGLEEAYAVALGLDALSYVGMADMAPQAESARAKLGRVLPSAASERVAAIRAAMVLERPRRVVDANAVQLMELAVATTTCHRVRMDYRARDGKRTKRTVEPLGVMQYEGRWFLGAKCLLRKGLRSFRVDRIENLETTDERFEPPPAFDLRAYIHRSLAHAGDRWRVEVWVDLDSEEVAWRLPPAFAQLHEEDGGTVIRCGSSWLPGTALHLLSLGAEVRIRRPWELREAFAEVALRSGRIAAGGQERS
ncbi:MAG: YafY family transcriptional regulator [Thermomicrobiales bacterium]|nr:YafY family transcriptional regulator [Thermomicrobiales bacterium]